jgi:hypothetical protein
MNRDLGVWTYEDCALVLIDYQPEMFEVIRSETDADLVELNATTALAVNTELFRDWATPAAGPARDVIYWYFTEAPRLTAAVGVADAEKRAATAALQGAG